MAPDGCHYRPPPPPPRHLLAPEHCFSDPDVITIAAAKHWHCVIKVHVLTAKASLASTCKTSQVPIQDYLSFITWWSWWRRKEDIHKETVLALPIIWGGWPCTYAPIICVWLFVCLLVLNPYRTWLEGRWMGGSQLGVPSSHNFCISLSAHQTAVRPINIHQTTHVGGRNKP